MADDLDETAPGRAGLTGRERRTVVVAATAPVAVVAVLLLALVATGGLGVVDLVVGTVVYGGLLGLAAGVVAHERAMAGHCPRCGDTDGAGRRDCESCGYDLVQRPVYLCEVGHERSYEPGLCECGRRLHERPPLPGLGRSIRRTLWVGAWMLAFLVGMGLLLGMT